MRTIKEIFDVMLELTHDLSAQITEDDEIDAVDSLQKSIRETRDVFGRTKDIE